MGNDKLKEEIQLLKETIHQKRKLLKEIQKVAHVGYWKFNFLTQKITWSHEAYVILGTKPKQTEPSLEAFLSFVHPQDITFVRKLINKSLDSLKNYSFYCRIIKPNGAVRHIFGEGIFELNRNKEPIRLYGIIHDITNFKKMQNEICMSEMLGQENERERFSRELHDGLGQMMVGIHFGLTGLEQRNRVKDPDLAKKISEINSQVKNSIREIRSISHNMSPHMLRKYGLVASVENILKSTTSIDVRFETNIKKSLPQHIEIILYRVTQELLSNILKHSKATKAHISLLKKGNEIILVAEDNGTGINKKHITGMGLDSIKNRINLVNGNLIIKNGDTKKGTRIEISVPF